MHNKKNLGLVLMVMMMVLAASQAFAVTAPANTAFAYDAYDFAVNDILNGPIGFVAGLGIVAAGIFMAVRNMYLPAVGTITSGGVLLAGDTVVQSMGAMIQ